MPYMILISGFSGMTMLVFSRFFTATTRCTKRPHRSSGSMKTQRGVLPLIESLSKHRESLILADPKGELYTRTRALLQERGYRVWVLNLRSPWQGQRFSSTAASTAD